MKEKEDPSERKNQRRKNIKFKNHKKNDQIFDDEENVKKNLSKRDYKRTKETLEDEEWEDWDRHYNH